MKKINLALLVIATLTLASCGGNPSDTSNGLNPNTSLPTYDGEKIVIRIMDYSMSLKGLESLCFNDINL